MTRRIPRGLAEECFRIMAGETCRRPVYVEFDIYAWKAGVRVPAFHPATEEVPEPTGPGLILEVLRPMKVHGGWLSVSEPRDVFAPLFMHGVYTPYEDYPDEMMAYWSSVTAPHTDDRPVIHEPGAKTSKALGPWRIWRATALLKGMALFKDHTQESGSDFLMQCIRETVNWLESERRRKKG